MSDQPQQHGVGGVDTEAIQAGIERLYKADFVGRGWLATWTADVGTLCADYDRLRARCASLEEELAEWHAVHAGERELRQLVEGHMDTARGEWSCVARCASLEAVAEAARGVINCVSDTDICWDHLGDGGCITLVSDVLAALDQHANAAREGTHG